LVLGSIAAVWFDAKVAYVAMALLAFTVTLAVTNIFRLVGWVAAVLSIVVYTLVQISLKGTVSAILIPSVVNAVAFIGTAWLGTITAQQLEAATRQLHNDQKLIEELRVHDSLTGLVRFQHARQTLRTEIIRSQRYSSDMCVILIQVANWTELEKEHGMVGADDMKKQIAGILSGALRGVDTPFINGRMGAILPETGPEGAMVVAQRLVDSVGNRVRVSLHVGAAHFPSDAVTDTEMLGAAEAALQIGLTSGRPIVFYSQIREGVNTEIQARGNTAPAQN
jgi:diguanylate cyclase (GGDEF)-like protein